MKCFTVHEEPGEGPSADRVDRASQLVFVPDGFSWTMAAFAPLVLLANRMWFGLMFYAAGLALIFALLSAAGSSPEWITLGVGALHTIFGFEAGELQRTALEAHGWTDVGTVTGRTLAECERRFIENWLPGQPLMAGLDRPNNAAPPTPNIQSVATSPATASPLAWLWPWRG